MQVFKAAVHTVLRHPVYLLTYAVFLSLMGVFMASSISFGNDDETQFSAYDVEYSIIDRDQSDVSRGLAQYLKTCGTRVDIEDSDIALQDAVAKNQSSYILIVPDGYGEAFAQAAHTGNAAPELETIYSYYSSEGSLLDQSVNEYLSIVRTWAAANPSAPISDATSQALNTMAESAEVELLPSGTSTAESQRFVFYLEWGTYTLFASIIVCVGVLMSVLNRTDLRRRNLIAPVPRLSYGLQIAAASLVITTAVWLWTIVLGMAVFHEAVSQISTIGVVCLVALSFVFATIPLSVGFLLGQMGVGEFASNAVGNIFGMVVSFMGGIWISFDLLAPAVQTVAHFTPAFWYVDALTHAAALAEATPSTLAPVLADAGIMLLFTAAIFAIALVMGRMRAQSVEAGGNAAAETLNIAG